MEWVAFTGRDFSRIIRARISGALPVHTHHELFLPFWRSARAEDEETRKLRYGSQEHTRR
jgi:hypothetical protein